MLGKNTRMAFAVVAAVLMVTTPVAGATSLQDLQSSGEAIPSDNIEPAQSQFQTADGSDARILNFNQESGDFEAGDRVTAEVEVRNTGESEHTFFVGYSVEGQDGNWYDNNEQTGKTVTLEPNEREWISLSWTVEDDAPTGDYDAVTSVWAESDRDNLQTRLDNERLDNALEVVEPTEIDAQILDFDVDSGEYREGESVDATATVENRAIVRRATMMRAPQFGRRATETIFRLAWVTPVEIMHLRSLSPLKLTLKSLMLMLSPANLGKVIR